MMEIMVRKSEFLRAISLVASVTSSKANTLPILGNLLFETVGSDQLKIVGTDLEVGISTLLPVKVIKEGSITLLAKKIMEIVRELPETELELSVAKNNAVNIKAGKAYFKIMGLSKEDYPKLPELDEAQASEIEQAVLKDSLTLTAFAISTDETRYVLNGVLMGIKDEQIKCVATDGRRLALCQRPVSGKGLQEQELIIPTKAVHELLKILTWEGVVQIIPAKTQVIFKIGDTFLYSRVIEGHFPNYHQVIPKEEKVTAQINREEFLQAIRRAALLTSPDSPAVKLDFLKGKILISSRAPNLGEAKEEILAEIKGAELAIGFNPQYLMDALKNIDLEQITFSLTEADKPGLIKGKEGYLYVIMPMQLN